VTIGPLLAHGLGKEPAVPEWPPLTTNETTDVLERFGFAAGDVVWRSPRPWSAAALVRTDSGTVFVKRHHHRVRSVSDLTVEHAFVDHLRRHDVPVPGVLTTPDGRSALSLDCWVYEVHQAAVGVDLYRDALSWTPYQEDAHAVAAGAALARFHLAAASFPSPARAGPPLLCTSARLISSNDVPTGLDQWLADRPATARYLAERDGYNRIVTALREPIARVRDIWPSLPTSWAHHDWHGSNLLWSSSGEISGVIDIGLADRTGPAFDLATALERSMISWLDLTDDPPGMPRVYFEQMAALLDGYQRVRPLTEAERTALPMLLPVVHVELALSEVEYYLTVRNDRSSADLAFEGYLLGHLAFFEDATGQGVLSALTPEPADHRRSKMSSRRSAPS
jgi:Ser/Thr protein kinase RdoA (MazF antagonist)